MTITPLNSKFYAEFDEIIGISRHFHEAQTLNFLRVIGGTMTLLNVPNLCRMLTTSILHKLGTEKLEL